MRSGFSSFPFFLLFLSRSSFLSLGLCINIGRRQRTNPFPSILSSLIYSIDRPPYQRHASIHQQRISHTHYSRIFPSLHPSHPSTHSSSNQMSFFSLSVPTDTSIPPQLTTPVWQAPATVMHPVQPQGANLGFHCVRNKLFFCFRFAIKKSGSISQQTHHLLILTHRHSSAAFLSSFLLCFFLFSRSNQTLSVLVIVIRMHTIWVT